MKPLTFKGCVSPFCFDLGAVLFKIGDVLPSSVKPQLPAEAKLAELQPYFVLHDIIVSFERYLREIFVRFARDLPEICLRFV